MRSKNNKMRVLTLTFYILYLHTIPNIIAYVERPITKVTIIFLVVHNLFAMAIYTLILLCRSNRGVVPNDEDLKRLLGRECKKCGNYKPERAHHCSRCGHCVKRMDHHCVWLGVCINSDNLAYFIRMLFLGLIGHVQLVLFLFFMMKYWCTSSSTYFVAITTAAVAGLGFLGLLFFFIVQMHGVVKNHTYIEHERYKDLIRYGIICPKSPYDLGVYRNLRVLLGYPFLLYMYGRMDNGLVFEKTYNCDEWPPFKFRDFAIQVEIQGNS
ncbi:Palmitoyltransferase PFA4 [Dictyocoela muelleri]|nr:Palmitoyltransferase PFA4 [Dictyocoela muelleri]